MAIAPPQIPGLADWRPVARGGFSVVWEARQESLNRLVAVKVDRRRLDADTEQRRFLREAGAAGRLSGHPGIVTVHDAGILGDDRPFLVMELCPGGSLTRWLEPDRRPTQRRVREVGVRIADALAAAHTRGVLHRDVKPANILIDAYDNPGLADFGLAALPDPDEELAETLDSITPAYAPPEVFHHRSFTEFGDVYSLAATLYALLNGRPPRWPETGTPSATEMLESQQHPIARVPGVVEPLMDLLLAALADEPTERPTAAQLRDRLADLDVPGTIPAVAAAKASGAGAAGAVAVELVAAVPKQVASDSPPPLPAEPGRTPPQPAVSTAEPEPPAAEPDRPTAPAEQPERSPAPRAKAPPAVRRRRLLILGLVLLVLVLILAVALTSLRSGPAPGAAPPPVNSATTTSVPATTTPTPADVVPAGFRDCASLYGSRTYCATGDECWSGIISLSDLPALGTRHPCDKTHVYQTFAAGRLPTVVRRQSELEHDPQVQALCSAGVANDLLSPKDQRSDWEIIALPPQETGADDLFHCLVGHGDRSTPLTFRR